MLKEALWITICQSLDQKKKIISQVSPSATSTEKNALMIVETLDVSDDRNFPSNVAMGKIL